MSFDRMVLRMLTVLALQGFENSRPTEAKERVFDSRNTPPQLLELNERHPTIIVYTDNDENMSMSDDAGPFERTISLQLELSIFQTAVNEFEGQDPNNPDQTQVFSELALFQTVTDAEAEATLDLMELQAKYALMSPHNIWSNERAVLVKQVKSWESFRHVEADTGIRFAQRLIEMKLTINEDCLEQSPIGNEGAYIERLKALLSENLPDSPFNEILEDVSQKLVASAATL